MIYGNSAPFFFVVSCLVYDVLIAGGTVHLYSDEIRKDVRLLEKYIEKNGITMSHISPAALRFFHNRSASLKTVVTIGEKLTGQCSRDGYRLFNLFGMTETVVLTSYEVPDVVLEEIPIGVPVRGSIEYAILDENGQKLKDGITGELCMSRFLMRI